ncbi:hypothetical protein Ate01nite_39830 [Actinoplanes teichomyceticus]|nr:hypothetical protein Ate01nite_39830 [Actinoplanes teichomyceticus]
MNAIRVERIGPGRPWTRPDHVIADKGYSTRAIRRYPRRRGIAHTIPERTDQQKHRRNRGPRGGRPPTFNKLIYRHRNVVERCFNRLEQCRSVATRDDKTRTSFQAPRGSSTAPGSPPSASGCRTSSPAACSSACRCAARCCRIPRSC